MPAMKLLVIALLCWTGAGLSTAPAAAPNSVAAPKSRVLVVRDPAVTDGFTVAAERVHAMVAAGVQSLTGAATEAEAWRQLVAPTDVVGIKINTQAAPLHSTHPAIVSAIAEGLRAAGVPRTNIIVWSREAELVRAALAALPQTPAPPFRIAGVIDGAGWDADSFYDSRVAGKLIWGDMEFGRNAVELSNRSHLPKLLTKTITKLINVPVLMDHDACGLDGCLYNISLDAVDNARRFELFGQRGDPAIAEIAALPVVHGKLIVNIMDALIGGYAGGPSFKPRYSWPAAALYLSRDPVAVDAVCLEAIESHRHETRVPPINDLASHIATAAALGLGQNERTRIELLEIAPLKLQNPKPTVQ